MASTVKISARTKKKLLRKKRQIEKELGCEITIPQLLEILASGWVRVKVRKRRKRPLIFDVFAEEVV